MSHKFLLLQIRNLDDPMRDHEVLCFAEAIGCSEKQIDTFDLILGCPTESHLDLFDAVLVGGSGDYSVVTGGTWFPAAIDLFRRLHETSKPTFASCWGFQAFAKALGGEVVTDLSRAEVGTHSMTMTRAGLEDPVFGPLGENFAGQLGHQDIVDRLPNDAVLLCSTKKVENQAFTFVDKPIYATQFHPEFRLEDLIKRLKTYSEYVASITGMEMDEFIATCRPTDETRQLLSRFVEFNL